MNICSTDVTCHKVRGEERKEGGRQAGEEEREDLSTLLPDQSFLVLVLFVLAATDGIYQ